MGSRRRDIYLSTAAQVSQLLLRVRRTTGTYHSCYDLLLIISPRKQLPVCIWYFRDPIEPTTSEPPVVIDIHCVPRRHRRRRQQPTYLVPFKRNKAASYVGRACFERVACDRENAWPRPNRKRSSSFPVAYVVERIFQQQKVFLFSSCY